MTIEPIIEVQPTLLQIFLGGTILILILKFYITEVIRNYKQKKVKPVKNKNDIKQRLKKANKKYYEKFNIKP